MNERIDVSVYWVRKSSKIEEKLSPCTVTFVFNRSPAPEIEAKYMLKILIGRISKPGITSQSKSWLHTRISQCQTDAADCSYFRLVSENG